MLLCLMAERRGYGFPTRQQAAQPPNGEPPAATEELTAEMVARYCQVIDWALDVRLTEAQKQKAKQFLRGYFERNDRERLRYFRSALETQRELAAMPSAERKRKCQRQLPYTMRKMRQEAKTGGAEAQWLQQVYFASHPVFLPGDPPLTREVADAWIAMDYFVRSRYYDSMKETAAKYPSVTFPRLRKVTPPTAATRARDEQRVRAKWKTLPVDERYKFFALPGEFAELKARWAGMSGRNRVELLQKAVLASNLPLYPVEE